MANASLFMDIIARDSASAVFNKIGNSAGTMTKGMDKAAKSHSAFGRAVKYAFGMVSMYSIGRFIGQSVKEYAAAELAQNKLESAYKRFPKLASTNIQSLRDLNTAMMQKTRFDDDAAAAMQANLARFDLTGKQILKLTPLVMDLAEATGTDLVTAGGQLGKAFLGNTRALKQLGIDYEMTGKRAKDTANIIDLVNKKVGGEATRAGKTTAVQLEILKNQYGELKESVGQALIPAFSKLVDVAGPAIKGLGDAIDENMPQIEQTFNDVWEAASKFGGALKGIWDGFSSMPEDVRNVLLALAGGTWAFGKIKGSALGTGISSLFSGIKTIAAGNVTVIGKSVTGTGPGAPAAKGGLMGTTLSTLLTGGVLTTAGIAVTSIVGTLLGGLVVAASFQGLVRKYAIDTVAGTTKWVDTAMARKKGVVQQGQTGTKVGSDFTANDSGKRGRFREEEQGINRVTAAQKGLNGVLARGTGLQTDWGKAAQAAGIKGTLGATAFGKSLDRIPKKKTTKVDVDGADNAKGKVKGLGAQIGVLRGKRVRVDEDGASASRGRVRNLDGAIRGLRGKRVRVDEDGASASRTNVANLGAAINALPTYKQVTIAVKRTGGAINVGATVATGGYISGPGTSTSDSVPAWLSNGEYVIKAEAVKRYGTALFHSLNAMRFARGGKVTPYEAAKREAKRQQRLSRFIASNFLGDNAADWLTGLDPKVARRFMKHPKKIGRFARMASSVSDQRALRDAVREYDASTAARGLAGMDVQTRRDTLAGRVSATRADLATAKGAAQKARLYAKLQEQEESLAQAEQELADAAAAAAEKEKSAQAAVRDAIESSASSYRNFASIATTSIDDVSAAQDKLTAAQDKVAEARRKFDLAGNDRDRAAAAKELAEAEKNATAAQQERNNASDKVTSSSIKANMGGKLTKLKGFAAAVKQLKANGLNAVTLADILAMGPDQGYDYAKALLDGGIGEINDLQAQITAESADLGLFTAGVNSAAGTAIGQANAGAAGLDISLVPAPVTLNLNGHEIAQALLEYQRQSGG